jgi:hypothetical protein
MRRRRARPPRKQPAHRRLLNGQLQRHGMAPIRAEPLSFLDQGENWLTSHIGGGRWYWRSGCLARTAFQTSSNRDVGTAKQTKSHVSNSAS